MTIAYLVQQLGPYKIGLLFFMSVVCYGENQPNGKTYRIGDAAEDVSCSE